MAYTSFLVLLLSSTGPTIKVPVQTYAGRVDLSTYIAKKSPEEKKTIFRLLVPLLGIPFLFLANRQYSKALGTVEESPANSFIKYRNYSELKSELPLSAKDSKVLQGSQDFLSMPVQRVPSESRSNYEKLLKEYSISSFFKTKSYAFEEEGNDDASEKEETAELTPDTALTKVFLTKKAWEDAGKPYDTLDKTRIEYEAALDAYLRTKPQKPIGRGQELTEQERLLEEVERTKRAWEDAGKPNNYKDEILVAYSAAQDAFMNSVQGAWLTPWISTKDHIHATLKEKTRKEWIQAHLPPEEFDTLYKLYQTSLNDAMGASLRGRESLSQAFLESFQNEEALEVFRGSSSQGEKTSSLQNALELKRLTSTPSLKAFPQRAEGGSKSQLFEASKARELSLEESKFFQQAKSYQNNPKFTQKYLRDKKIESEFYFYEQAVEALFSAYQKSFSSAEDAAKWESEKPLLFSEVEKTKTKMEFADAYASSSLTLLSFDKREGYL